MNETLNIKVGLKGTHWGDKLPQFTVLIDDTVLKTGNANELEVHEFNVDIPEGPHILKIRLENKEDSDTVQDNSGNLVKDLLLNIVSLEIDQIDVGNLRWKHSTYTLDKPAEIRPGEFVSEYSQCTDLGHNGTWQFAFNSPFYIWLLENL